MKTRLEVLQEEYEDNKKRLDTLRMERRDIKDKLREFEREGLEDVLIRSEKQLKEIEREYNNLYNAQRRLSLEIREEEVRETKRTEEKRVKEFKKAMGLKVFSPIKSFRTFISAKYITKDIPIAELRATKSELESELRYYREYSSYIEDEIRKVENEREKDKSRFTSRDFSYDDYPEWIKKEFERKYDDRIKHLEDLKRTSDDNIDRIESKIETIDKNIEKYKKNLLKKASKFVKDFERGYEKVRRLNFLDPKISLQIKKGIRREYWREYKREHEDLISAKRLRSQKPHIRRVNPIIRAMYGFIKTQEKQNKMFNRYLGDIGITLGVVGKLKNTYKTNQDILKNEIKRFKKTEDDIKGWQKENILFELEALREIQRELDEFHKELINALDYYEEVNKVYGDNYIERSEMAAKEREDFIKIWEDKLQQIKDDSTLDEREKKRQTIGIEKGIFELEKEVSLIKGDYETFTSGVYYFKYNDLERDYEDVERKRATLPNRIKYLEWKLKQIENAEKIRENVERATEEQEEVINDLKKEAQSAKKVRRELSIISKNLQILTTEVDKKIDELR